MSSARDATLIKIHIYENVDLQKKNGKFMVIDVYRLKINPRSITAAAADEINYPKINKQLNFIFTRIQN